MEAIGNKSAEFFLTHDEYQKLSKILPIGYSLQIFNKRTRNPKINKTFSENFVEKRNSVFENSNNRVSRAVLNDLNKKGSRIISKIKKSRFSNPFLYPVDTVSLNLPDYHIIIKQPMDLSTVEKNLKNSKYTNSNEYDEDMKLIWSNAKLYNPEGTEIHRYADELEKQYLMFYNEEFNENYISDKKTVEEKRHSINNDKPLTYNEKKNLSQLIRSLSTEDLYGVWEIICDGMDQIYDQQEIEIDIDKLSNKKARELEKYVKSKVTVNKKVNKNTFNNNKIISNEIEKDIDEEDSNSNNSSFFKKFASDSN